MRHDDGADAARAGDGPKRYQQFLDDDRSQPLGRFVQQQHFRIERERPSDRQHLLLATGKLVAEMVAPLLQARKHLVDPGERPRPRLRHGRHILLDRQRTENVALLRHPADTDTRALVRPHRRDISIGKCERAAEAAGDADDRIDQRGLAGAVAAQQRQHLAFAERQ